MSIFSDFRKPYKSYSNQFSEILKIKLRNKICRSRFQAQKIWRYLEENGGSFFVSEDAHQVLISDEFDLPSKPAQNSNGVSTSSDFLGQFSGAFSLLMPQNALGRVTLVGVSFLALGSLYKRLVQDIRPFALILLLKTGYDKASLKLYSRDLDSHLNFLFAFEENGRDELENEKVVKDWAEQIAIRFVNHVFKFSKNGQKTFADVLVNRMFKHLSRHRYGFENESMVWYKSELQQLSWSLRTSWRRFVLPADRVGSPQPIGLVDRCIRAFAAETFENDYRVLELEALHEQSETQWTAADILSKSAVNLSDQIYGHSQTDAVRYGFVYGTQIEIKWRKMSKL